MSFRSRDHHVRHLCYLRHLRYCGLRSESGQATAEYALVMLAAAALAGLLLAWASGTDGIDRLLDAVLDQLIDQT